jgi:DNA anti-recombination protein RmuC
MSFYEQATKMLAFLEQFKKHIDQMETDFEHAVFSSQQMNGMLATYEGTLIESYGDGRRLNTSHSKNNDDHYLIFDAGENADMRLEIEGLSSKMQNPFTNMRRWLKFELLDLGAIL